MTDSACIVKDMGVSHGDFWRIFAKVGAPGLTSHIEPHLGESRFNIPWMGGRVTVEVGAEQVRRLATLIQHHTLITLTFDGVEPSAIEQFVAEFDRRFQRGGG